MSYSLVVAVLAFVMYVFVPGSRAMLDADVVAEYLIVFAVVFSLGLYPFLHRWSRPATVGTVIQLRRGDGGADPKEEARWVFDLQLCDRSWQPQRDRSGFLLPRVEVTYHATRVHGDEIDEGCPVAVIGRPKRGAIKASEVWNLTVLDETGLGVGQTRVVGRVTDWQPPDRVVDTRYADGRTLQVYTFRVQPTDAEWVQARRDEHGGLIPAVPIEIRAREITGSLQDGDRVVVVGRMRAGTLHAREVINHSAGGAALTVKGPTRVA
ncbi:hypothetical protein GCM10009841_21750 [Microlunatus panaciterrae]